MKNKINGFLIIFILIGILLTFAVYYVTSSPVKALKQELDTYKSTTASIYNQLSIAKFENETQKKDVITNISGVDKDIITKNKEDIALFLNKVFTWDSYESYIKLRTEIARTYNLKDDDNFLKYFMPFIENYKSGDTYTNLIDASGLNIKYTNMRVNLLSIQSNVYKYLVECTVTSSSNLGTNESSKCVLLLSMNNDKNLENGGLKIDYVSKVEE